MKTEFALRERPARKRRLKLTIPFPSIHFHQPRPNQYIGTHSHKHEFGHNAYKILGLSSIKSCRKDCKKSRWLISCCCYVHLVHSGYILVGWACSSSWISWLLVRVKSCSLVNNVYETMIFSEQWTTNQRQLRRDLSGKMVTICIVTAVNSNSSYCIIYSLECGVNGFPCMAAYLSSRDWLWKKSHSRMAHRQTRGHSRAAQHQTVSHENTSYTIHRAESHAQISPEVWFFFNLPGVGIGI